MSEARRPWQQALDLAVRLGYLTPDRAEQLAAGATAATEQDAVSLVSSAGVPPEVMDALLRLATAMSGKPPEAPTTAATGVSSLASDMEIDLVAPPPSQEDAPRPVVVTLKAKAPSTHQWRFEGPANIVIGRSRQAHVRLDDTSASGVHAVIEVTGVGCRVRDMRSANHTYVNGERADLRELADGDEVRIGRTHLKLQLHAARPSTMKMSPPSLDPEVPGYPIQTLLGKGGQGHVYLANDQAQGGRLVALKTMQLPYSLDDDECDRRSRYFLREAMVAHAFRHPNVVEVHASGRAGRTVYLAMEYLPGGDLAAYVAKAGELPVSVACRFVLQALEAMAVAHARKLVHRDLKPANLLLTKASHEADIKVVDLGLAKFFELAGLSGFTESGICCGTPEYMPLEQLMDYKYVGPPTDVFALGAILFRLLTGRGVRAASGGEGDMADLLDAPIPPVLGVRPDLPSALAAVVDRALEREPERRYEHAGAMRDALRAATG